MPRTKKQEKESQEPSKEKKIAKAPKKFVHASGEKSQKEQFLGDDQKNQGSVYQQNQSLKEKSKVIKRQQQRIDKQKISKNGIYESALNESFEASDFEQSGDSKQEQADCYQRSHGLQKEPKKRQMSDHAEKRKASEQAQEQSQKDSQQNSNSEQSSPVTPAVQGMKFRKVRGTKMQDLIDGKVKINQSGLADKQVNDYLGVKKKTNSNEQKQPAKINKKRKPVSDSQESVYDFNHVDSDDQESYIQSSSGRDQFDSDFDLTQSYPGKRGRKKGSKAKKRGKGRGRPRSTTAKHEDSPQQKGPRKKRGRPRKILYDENGNQILTPIPPKQIIRKEDRTQNQGTRKRGRPRKYLISPETPTQKKGSINEHKDNEQIIKVQKIQKNQKGNDQFQRGNGYFAKAQEKQKIQNEKKREQSRIQQEKPLREYQQFEVKQDRQIESIVSKENQVHNYQQDLENQFVNDIMENQQVSPQQGSL